ncbi:hypothetical protein FGB62_48g074 [Gracilaria domingensis]|nr:hypothetical protein FGB62_48g074 [Gracilaria domingensis]
MFSRDELRLPPESLPTPERTKIETRDDLHLNLLRSAEKNAGFEQRTTSLSNITVLPSFQEQRLSSAVLPVGNDASTGMEIDESANRVANVEVVAVSSDNTSSDSLDKTISGGSRLFSLRDIFRKSGSQDQRVRTSHISLGSRKDIRLHKPPKDEPSRLLLRRSSSLPQDIRTSAGASKGASNPRSKRLASSDDGLQCPWGVKATKKRSGSLVVRNNAPLTFLIADISSALNFTAKRDNSSSSKSINLSDDDFDDKKPVLQEKQDSEIEMQHDDFIEYTVKMAKKQRK